MYANPFAKKEEMMEACKKANIHDFIMKQEHGYDTQVGNRGLKLSGGEKQRISIARVLLKNPSVMIFDEATSSVDPESEQEIWKCIGELAKTRTLMIISHRLSSIRNADVIYVLEDGYIREHGNHEELTKNNGLYYQLCEEQRILEGALV